MTHFKTAHLYFYIICFKLKSNITFWWDFLILTQLLKTSLPNNDLSSLPFSSFFNWNSGKLYTNIDEESFCSEKAKILLWPFAVNAPISLTELWNTLWSFVSRLRKHIWVAHGQHIVLLSTNSKKLPSVNAWVHLQSKKGSSTCHHIH